jgi:DNA-binding NarL/FixJ family response regulator
MSSPNKVVIVDGMDFRRSCIAGFLTEWASREEVDLVALPPSEAHQLLRAGIGGMIVLNVGAAPCSQTDALAEIKVLLTLAPAAALVVLADGQHAEDVVSALQAGAHGYVPNLLAPDLVLRALSFVLHGGTYFPRSVVGGGGEPLPDGSELGAGDDRTEEGSPVGAIADASSPLVVLNRMPEFSDRQRAILEGLCLGQSNKIIGRGLSLPDTTIKVHVREIMRKLGVCNRTQVAIVAPALKRGGRQLPDRTLRGAVPGTAVLSDGDTADAGAADRGSFPPGHLDRQGQLGGGQTRRGDGRQGPLGVPGAFSNPFPVAGWKAVSSAPRSERGRAT